MAISKIKTKSIALSSVDSDIILNNSIQYIDLSFDVGNDIQNTKTTVQSNSANWDSVYTSVNSASANWDFVYNNSFNFALTSDARFSDSRTPTGAAGGDLDGTYPNPTIKNSVALFGQPTAPTAAAGTHTTQIATTEFVQNNRGDTYFTTSTSTNTIDNSNGKTFVVASSSLSYTPTQDVTITWDGDPLNYHMHCTVVSFSGYDLVVNVNSHSGNGTHSNWSINVGGFTTQTGVLLQSNNLSDVASASTSLTNLGGVSTSRTISAGTGLTGGGDLTTDRTLSVVFGNTSATAVSGDDPRLSDARTPTAHKSSHAIGGTDLLSPSDIGAVDVTTYQQASGNWQSTYSTVLANSSTNWDNESVKSYADSKFLPMSGGTLTGNLSVLGELIYVDTSVAVVSTMYIDTNSILDPALRITQRGTGDVIRVEDSANPDTTPFIINSDGLVGVGVSSPNEKLTVVGNISASGLIYGDGSNLIGLATNSDFNVYKTDVSSATASLLPTTTYQNASGAWQNTYTTVQTNSSQWDSAYTTVQNNSSSKWDNDAVYQYASSSFLPLSGGTLTGTIIGDLSATGSFYGDGSKLTGIIAGDTEATTLVRSNSANWESVYTTVLAESASWIGGSGTGADTEVRALTSNWQSTYTTVLAESASWIGGGGSSDYLPLSGGSLTGTLIGDLSATGSFYGDGSKLTGIIAGDTEATTLVRSNSGFWEGAYTTVSSMSASWQTTFSASSAYVSSNPQGISGASALTKLLQITQAGYNSITPASDTLYIIVG